MTWTLNVIVHLNSFIVQRYCSALCELVDVLQIPALCCNSKILFLWLYINSAFIIPESALLVQQEFKTKCTILWQLTCFKILSSSPNCLVHTYEDIGICDTLPNQATNQEHQPHLEMLCGCKSGLTKINLCTFIPNHNLHKHVVI